MPFLNKDFSINNPRFPFIIREEEQRLLSFGGGVCGIYQIFNLENGKVYIGSSKKICRRMRTHANDLINNYHSNRFLQFAANKSGKSMVFSVVEECKPDELLEKEIFYISLYNARNDKFGYNLQSADRCDSESRWSAETIEKMSNKRKAYFNKNPHKRKEQIDNLRSFWNDRDSAIKCFEARSKNRSFFNEKTGEVFIGSIGSLRRKYPDDKLDKAALLRVSQGKNKRYKNWIKTC